MKSITTFIKSETDKRTMRKARGMQGYREPTEEDVDEIAKSLSDGIFKRLKAGKGLSADQATQLTAVGKTPSVVLNEILNKAKAEAKSMGISQPEGEEEELRKGKYPSWALDRDTYFRALEIASDKGKLGDVRYIKRLYERLGGPIVTEERLVRALDTLTALAAQL